MLAKTIDRSLCDGCGKCVRICRSCRVIAMDPDGFPRYAFVQRCIDCGHCLAICPRGAISFARGGAPGYGTYMAEARVIEGEGRVANPMLRLLFSVRSTRFFDARQVERDKLELVLESMVRAPSAGNEQNRNFYIFAPKPMVDGLETDTREYFRGSTAQFADPAVAMTIAEAMAARDSSGIVMRNRTVADLPPKARAAAYAELLRDVAERPGDPGFSYFGGAPAAILVTSNTNTQELHKAYYRSDVELAVTYGAIAAAAIGLCSCRMGLSEMAFGQDARMREKHGIPAEERVDGILAIGYSSLLWTRIPPRGPVKVSWRTSSR